MNLAKSLTERLGIPCGRLCPLLATGAATRLSAPAHCR